jgi:hypothetical protein
MLADLVSCGSPSTPSYKVGFRRQSNCVGPCETLSCRIKRTTFSRLKRLCWYVEAINWLKLLAKPEIWTRRGVLGRNHYALNGYTSIQTTTQKGMTNTSICKLSYRHTKYGISSVKLLSNGLNAVPLLLQG